MMKSYIKPTLVLTLICLVITSLLAITDTATSPIIAENERRAAELARAEVLPEADSFTQQEGSFPDSVSEVYAADNGVGYTVTVSSKGYDSDPLKVMVGIRADGTVEKVKVLNNSETPGLGSKVSDESFVGQFVGMDASMEGLQLIAGATISSNAMRTAMETAFEVYSQVKGA